MSESDENKPARRRVKAAAQSESDEVAAAEGTPKPPKRPRGRPPKDPLRGPLSEAERAAKARARRKQEKEDAGQRTQCLANSFAAALLYLTDADPQAARWVVTPLAPLPESAALDAIAAKSHAAQMDWVQSQLVNDTERELFGRFVTAIQNGTYASDDKLRTAVDSAWGYRRAYELGRRPQRKVPRKTNIAE